MADNNNNYCFISPTNYFTIADPDGITDDSSNDGMIDDDSSTTNPNQADPNDNTGNSEISIVDTILSVSQSAINSNTIQVNNNTGQMNQILDSMGTGNYNLFLTTGRFMINGSTINPLTDGFFYITFTCFKGANIIFQDDKLYRILGINQTKNYGFNFLLPNHDRVIISITDQSSNIDVANTKFTNGTINWTGLIKP